MAKMRTLTADNFDRDVLRSNVPVVVDFSAAWCGPCRLLAPVLERVAEGYRGRVNFLQVDVDGEPELAERFAVNSVTTLAFFRNGRPVDRHEGLIDPRLLLLKLDRLAASATRTTV